MRSIITVTAAAACLFLAGCEGFIEPTDGSLPLLSQRPAETTRTDGGVITVDGRNYLLTNVEHRWVEDGQTGWEVGARRTNRYFEVRVANRTRRCDTEQQCVRTVRNALREERGEEM